MDLNHTDPPKNASTEDGSQDDELDTRLLALFRSIDGPTPSPQFAARTLQTVKRAPVVDGRRPLRSPWAGIAGWAALVAGVALSAATIALTTPVFASLFATLVSLGLGIGIRLLQWTGAGLALSDVFATAGLAVSRVVMTPEGSTALLLTGVVGATALSALHRLLMSEGPEGGVSQWQEL